MNNTEKFSGRAEVYTKGRPSYALELIECLYEKYGFTAQSIIADIGSGTGKLAKQLLDKGSTVFGVEPNRDMRNIAEKELGGYKNFRSVDGSASATNLVSESVDFITSAQAFHWFDVDEFRAECKRIMRTDGKIILIWNTRDMDFGINRESYDIFTRYCPNFKGFGGGIQKDDRRIVEFFGGKYEREIFENPLYFDRDKFISRSLSGSYSLKKGDAGFEVYLEELNQLFDKYAENNIVKLGNNSAAYIGTV